MMHHQSFSSKNLKNYPPLPVFHIITRRNYLANGFVWRKCSTSICATERYLLSVRGQFLASDFYTGGELQLRPLIAVGVWILSVVIISRKTYLRKENTKTTKNHISLNIK